MGESKFLSQQIEATIHKEEKTAAVRRAEEQKQKQSKIEESKMIEQKWSTKRTPHFTTAKEKGYATRNTIQRGKKGELHPTWRGPR